jgi:hypothetical protein
MRNFDLQIGWMIMQNRDNVGYLCIMDNIQQEA